MLPLRSGPMSEISDYGDILPAEMIDTGEGME